MRKLLVALGAVLLAVVAVWGGLQLFGSDSHTTAQAPPPAASSAPSSGCGVSEQLVPNCGVLFGASSAPQPGQTAAEALVAFEGRIGRKVGIAHFYHNGTKDVWPTSTEISMANDGRLLLLNWKPKSATWRQVADGADDDYLTSVGQHIKAAYDKPFFLSINAEMEDEVRTDPAQGQTAQDFADMFRHVVSTLRAAGADQIVPVLVYTGAAQYSTEPWYSQLYPGDSVVSWIGEDPYAYGKSPVFRSDFAGIVNRRLGQAPNWPGFYTWATTTHPGKPIMLGEWGVTEDPTNPNYKPDFFRSAVTELPTRFPKIKAIVYFDTYRSPMGQLDIDSSAPSLQAFDKFAGASLFSRDGY